MSRKIKSEGNAFSFYLQKLLIIFQLRLVGILLLFQLFDLLLKLGDPFVSLLYAVVSFCVKDIGAIGILFFVCEALRARDDESGLGRAIANQVQELILLGAIRGFLELGVLLHLHRLVHFEHLVYALGARSVHLFGIFQILKRRAEGAIQRNGAQRDFELLFLFVQFNSFSM